MRTLCTFLLLLVLSACAAVPRQSSECVHFSADAAFCLLPPAAIQPVRVTHLVRISSDKSQQVFIGRLQVDRNEIRLAATSLFGPDLFVLRYDGHALSVRGGDKRLRPAFVLAVMEFVAASPKQLATALRGLSEHSTADGLRCLMAHGARVMCVNRTAGNLQSAKITVTVPASGLSIRMTPLAAVSATSETGS